MPTTTRGIAEGIVASARVQINAATQQSIRSRWTSRPFALVGLNALSRRHSLSLL